MNRRHFSLAAVLACAAGSARSEVPENLAMARAKFKTEIHYPSSNPSPVAKPPKGVLDIVSYPSAVGNLAAYLSPNPKDGKKHPAIIWLTGGETNTIDNVWSPSPRGNDQSAAAYRKAGVIMMYPSLRGGSRNPGELEGFFGEVDDVLAAADYLAGLPYVDTNRIYLGGHSTGGTLACLTAEVQGSRFRAVFASGPVHEVSAYGDWFCPYDFSTLPDLERSLRAPWEWLSSVNGKLFIIEATDDGNIDSLRFMKSVNTNPNVTFIEVSNADHFSVLAPLNDVIADKIIADTGDGPLFSLTEAEIKARK